MERIKVSNNFFLDEFVDPVTYFTMKCNGLSLMDNKLFDIAQLLRVKYGKPIFINRWWDYLPKDIDDLVIVLNKEEEDKCIKDKKKYFNPFTFLKEMQNKKVSVWSGLRTELCSIGAPLSAHKLAKGIDPKGDQRAMLKVVEENAKEFYRLGLRRIEDISITIGWLHMDTHERNCLPNKINVVDLKTVVRRIAA
jgi:hypothetical protein